MVYILCGIVFGITQQFRPKREGTGKRSADWHKIIVFGIPLLLFCLWEPLYLAGVITFPSVYFLSGSSIVFYSLASFASGFVIISGLLPRDETAWNAVNGLANFGGLLGFVCVLFLISSGYYRISVYASYSSILRNVDASIILALLCVACGAAFGIIHQLTQREKEKRKHRIDWYKLLFFGIPLLLLILWDPLYWIIPAIPFRLTYIGKYSTAFYSILSFAFGYIVISGLFAKGESTERQ